MITIRVSKVLLITITETVPMNNCSSIMTEWHTFIC